jgi:hypothetical protein
LTIAILIGYPFGITLWDWIKLLVVPAVLAGGGLWFNAQQSKREQHIANQRAQDEALQAYLNQMSDILIPSKDQRTLSEESPPDSLRSVARARTLTVLTRLDGDRKGIVVQFVYESGLIYKDRRVVDLKGADLSEANLREANLIEADLLGAYLFKADLRWADLGGADFHRAKGITNEELAAQSNWHLLKGATMPDGQMYEDWLESKGGVEER